MVAAGEKTTTTGRRRCSRAVTVCAVLAHLVSRSSGETGVGVGGFAAVLDEIDRCAAATGTADPWPCLKRGGRMLVTAAVQYPGEIPLVGPYLVVAPPAGGRDRRGGAGNGTSSSSSSSVYSRFTEFARGRMLRASLPLNAVARLLLGDDESGASSHAIAAAAAAARGKKDKGAGVLMLGGMMMITTLMATAFGALALMAAKGLFTSVLALMLSAMAVAKKSGHGHARTTYEVVNALSPAAGNHHRYQDAETVYHHHSGNDIAAAAAAPDVSMSGAFLVSARNGRSVSK